jgi:hypothetical protein
VSYAAFLTAATVLVPIYGIKQMLAFASWKLMGHASTAGLILGISELVRLFTETASRRFADDGGKSRPSEVPLQIRKLRL